MHVASRPGRSENDRGDMHRQAQRCWKWWRGENHSKGMGTSSSQLAWQVGGWQAE